MQPAHSPPDLTFLLQAWQQFTATASIRPGLDPLVALSWQRCGPRLNPLGALLPANRGEEALRLTKTSRLG